MHISSLVNTEACSQKTNYLLKYDSGCPILIPVWGFIQFIFCLFSDDDDAVMDQLELDDSIDSSMLGDESMEQEEHDDPLSEVYLQLLP